MRWPVHDLALRGCSEQVHIERGVPMESPIPSHDTQKRYMACEARYQLGQNIMHAILVLLVETLASNGLLALRWYASMHACRQLAGGDMHSGHCHDGGVVGWLLCNAPASEKDPPHWVQHCKMLVGLFAGPAKDPFRLKGHLQRRKKVQLRREQPTCNSFWIRFDAMQLA